MFKDVKIVKLPCKLKKKNYQYQKEKVILLTKGVFQTT